MVHNNQHMRYQNSDITLDCYKQLFASSKTTHFFLGHFKTGRFVCITTTPTTLSNNLLRNTFKLKKLKLKPNQWQLKIHTQAAATT